MKRFLLPLVVILTAISATAADKRPPNFIVLLIDDMGWSDSSCFGNKDARTPNIDQLASEGIRFKQFYVNSPICSPSRCALTTGRYPQQWRITSFLENRASNNSRGMAQWRYPKPTSPSATASGSSSASTTALPRNSTISMPIRAKPGIYQPRSPTSSDASSRP